MQLNILNNDTLTIKNFVVRPLFEWLGLTNLLVLFLFKSFNLKREDGGSLAGFLFKSVINRIRSVAVTISSQILNI